MIGSIVELAHSIPERASFERGALEVLRREIGFEVAQLIVRGREQDSALLGFDEAQTARLRARSTVYGQEMLPVKQAALAAGGVAVDREVLGSKGMAEAAYFRELARPMGGRSSLLGCLRWRGRVVGALMLGRTTTGFSGHDKARLAEVLPALAMARATYGLPVAYAPMPPAPPRGWLERMRSPKERRLASVSAGEHDIVVRDRGGYREMVARGAGQELVWTRSSLREPSRSGWPYADLFHLAAAVAGRRDRALFIGCGGAVSLRQFASRYPGIAIDVIDCDARVFDVARRWFGLDDVPGVATQVGDGVALVERATASSWDIVVVDAYGARGLAESFRRRRFYRYLRRVLRPSGAVAVNVIGRLAGPGPVREVLQSMRAELAEPRLHPVIAPDERQIGSALRNVVIVAGRGD